MDDALRKIRALCTTNNEIVERISNCETTTWFSYEKRWGADGKLEMVEHTHSWPTSELVEKLSASTSNNMETNILMIGTTGILPDLTSPNLTWESVKRLNIDMVLEVEKLTKLLDRNPNNPGPEFELRKYLRNYEKLQVMFGDLEERTMSHPSRMAELREEAVTINQALDTIQKVQIDSSYLNESTLTNAHEFGLLTIWYAPGGKSLRLLYRGSRDGMEASTFHRLCDGQGPTVTVIKESEAGYIFGGYTAASWGVGPDEFVACTETSLFTLRNPQQLPPQRFEISNTEHAIFVDARSGPAFGRGHDVSTGNEGTIGVGAYTYVGWTFDTPTGFSFHNPKKRRRDSNETNYFSLGDIEVFAVAGH